MGLFDFFFNKSNKVNWEEIKTSDKVYPQPAISIIMIQSESGKPATGWIDLAYKDYPYKKHCPINLQFNIWLDENSPVPDMGTVEEYFVNMLKPKCIVHRVARVATDFGMEMDLYIDNSEFALQVLNELSESEDKLVEFGCGLNYDPQWKEYDRITQLLT